MMITVLKVIVEVLVIVNNHNETNGCDNVMVYTRIILIMMITRSCIWDDKDTNSVVRLVLYYPQIKQIKST